MFLLLDWNDNLVSELGLFSSRQERKRTFQFTSQGLLTNFKFLFVGSSLSCPHL